MNEQPEPATNPSQASPIPNYEKQYPQGPSPNPQVPNSQYNAGYQQQAYPNVPPPPPGAFTGATLYTPVQQSWMSSGASVAGVVIAGRCLIGFVTSGIFLIITAVIMYNNANTLDAFDVYRNSTNPLRVIAPIALTLGIFFLVGGIVGVIIAMREVNRSRNQANTSTTTMTIGPAPIISGVQNTYGQPNQYYGTGGQAYPPPANPPGGQNAGPSMYPQQSYAQTSAGPDTPDAPPPYNVSQSSTQLQRY